MNTGMEGIFGTFAIAYAIYAFYVGYEMKVKKDITKSILLTKTINPRKCKDKKAYIDESFPLIIILGVATLAYGIAELVNAYVMPLGIGLTGVIALVLAVAFVVYVKAKKINEKYF